MTGAMLDAAIVLLLLVALALGLRLHLSLRRLRRDDGELDRLIGALGEAVDRAEAALGELKATVGVADQRWSTARTEAERLLDDLRFLGERGTQVADRLEAAIRSARSVAEPLQPGAQAPLNHGSRPATPNGAGRTNDLERALRTLR